MAKITISSTRVYYNQLHHEDVQSIKHDIRTYQSMKKKAYKELYDNYVYGNQTLVNPKYLKNIYHTNDYFPLSAISESKGVLKSQKTWYKQTLKNKRNKLKKIEKKINTEESLLNKYTRTLDDLIINSKARKEGKTTKIHLCPDLYLIKDEEGCIYKGTRMNLYLFEVQHLKPLIKLLKNRIKLLRYRKQRTIEELERLEYRMKMIYFKKCNYIKITGRAQGKYCNNLFKYDQKNNEMTYISTKKQPIVFTLDFPYRKEELIRVLNLKHETPGKAVCYTLIDKGDYFIIYATIELSIDFDEYQMDIRNDVVGIDINADLIAVAQTNHHGNLIQTYEIPLRLKGKTRNQRKWMIEQVVNEVMKHCKMVNKPLIIEELNFEKKKREFKLYKGNKRYHQMLSEFAYRQIIEKLYSRAYKVKMGIHEVDPSYTSQMGKVKYTKEKGISIHRSAAYVIARRGMGYKERLPKRIYGNVHQSYEERWTGYLQKMR